MAPLIKLENLRKYFAIESGFLKTKAVQLRAVDGVSLEIKEGDTFGLVGESGCGKTTIGKLLLKLYEPTSGKIEFSGEDVTHINGKKLHEYRANIQAVFQNPYASLNPRMRIWKLIGEPLMAKGQSPDEIKERVKGLLELVMLPKDSGNRFSHEMSAGQRQQVAIARALSINPKFIILDEPTSLLDVSAQASILNMVSELQQRLKLTYLFISHNLAVVRFLSNRVGVMYCGKVVELADSRDLYVAPQHPYSKALLASILSPDPKRNRQDVVIDGDVMSPIDPPDGCRFHGRCRHALRGCRDIEPSLIQIQDGHFVACHLLK